MSDRHLKAPVAFIIFNRPDTTEKVFNEIAKAKPSKLLVIADGPRVHRDGEAARCAETRKIIERVDWECDVLTNYSDSNLGCKNRVASGIDWVFEQVPEAIILEDDCLPHPDFFRFCDELLELYRDDKRVSMIGGSNLQFGTKRGAASYYFSRFNHIWGWASWRRAWQHYDSDAKLWPEFRDANWLAALFEDRAVQKFWAGAFESVYQKKIDTWDYQWVLAAWTQGMLTILPSVNLISNIGFGAGATHTHGDSPYASLATGSLAFPLTHPAIVLPHREADEFTARGMFRYSLKTEVLRKIKRTLLRT